MIYLLEQIYIFVYCIVYTETTWTHTQTIMPRQKSLLIDFIKHRQFQKSVSTEIILLKSDSEIIVADSFTIFYSDIIVGLSDWGKVD